MLTHHIDKTLKTALRVNKESALHTALLMLPAQFTEEELYTNITSISYKGKMITAYGQTKVSVKLNELPSTSN